MVKTIEGSQGAPRTPSIDPAEVAKFSAMAADWWDPKGKFRPLHLFNPVRLKFIRETAERHFGIAPGKRTPLEGLKLLDIGCGGGLVCEPMARLGADVTGVDASEANIKTALTHAGEQGLAIDYRAGTAEGLIDAGEGPFDVVLNLEVVEHVADPRQFLMDTASLVRPGGLMIVATLNRTAKSLATAGCTRTALSEDGAVSHRAMPAATPTPPTAKAMVEMLPASMASCRRSTPA